MAIRKRLSDTRVSQAIDERDDMSGTRRPGVIDYKQLAGIPELKIKDDQSYKFNIIPFESKNELNPSVFKGTIKLGELDLWLDVWAHRDVGTEKAFVLCPSKMWGKPCPFCEKKSELYDAGKDAQGKKLQPTKRVIMFVEPWEKGDPKPVHLFEVSHYSFAQPLLSKADRLRKEGKIKNFGDPEDGNLLKFYVEKSSNKAYKGSLDYVDFEFLVRDEDIPDEVLNVPSLDEFMITHTYEELQALLAETVAAPEDDEDEEDDRGSRRGGGRDRGERSSRGGREEREPRGGREESRGRGEGRAQDESRESRRERDRGESRSERSEEGSSRRGRSDESERQTETERKPRTERPEDYAPKDEGDRLPSQPTRQRPVEEVSAPIQKDDRCPHGHGWGTEAVDKFPQCDGCSKWELCLEGK